MAVRALRSGDASAAADKRRMEQPAATACVGASEEKRFAGLQPAAVAATAGDH